MAAVKKKTAPKAAKKKTAKKKAVAKKKVTKKKAAKASPAKKATKKKAAKSAAKASTASKVTLPKAKTKAKAKAKKAVRRPKPLTVPSRPVAPAVKPLNKTEKKVFRATLDEKQKEIHALYNHDVRKGLRTTNDGAEDVVDRANQAYNRELNFALSDGERELLMQIEEAQVRLETPQFGVCLNCQSPIARLRLDAVPWAKYCIDCQEMQERGLLSE